MSRRRKSKKSPTLPEAAASATPVPATVPPVAGSPDAPLVAPPPAETKPSATPAASTSADELRGFVTGLLFLSESEAPFTVVELPKDAILPDALRTMTSLPPDAPAEEWTVADILAPRLGPDDPDAARFRDLLTFLTTRLTRAVVYKLGSVKKPVFFIGRQPDKSWLGLQTEAVET